MPGLDNLEDFVQPERFYDFKAFEGKISHVCYERASLS